MLRDMTFRDWLEGEIGRQGVSRRELARRLAAQYPGSGDTEANSQRTTLKRILGGKTRRPSKPTRDAICDALGVSRDAPPVDDGDAPITREELHEFRRLSLKLERSLFVSERALPARAQRMAAR